jgi:hypothetical protein
LPYRFPVYTEEQFHSALVLTAHGVSGAMIGFPETSFRSYRISRTFELLVWTTLLKVSEHKDVAHGVPQRNMRSIIFVVKNNSNNNNKL